MTEQIDPALWGEPDMHRALAVRDVGEVYRQLGRVGISQRQISELTDQSQSEVNEICRGYRQVLAYDLLVRIADGLGVPRGPHGAGVLAGLRTDTYGGGRSSQRAGR